MSLLTEQDLTLRVSSVLNKDVKQFGKQFLIDGKDETCWNSDQGTTQWIDCRLSGDRCVRLRKVGLQFQGGFAAKHIVIEYFNNENESLTQKHLYTSDSNDLQVFSDLPDISAHCLRFQFNHLYDFFGRIIVYKLQLFAD